MSETVIYIYIELYRERVCLNNLFFLIQRAIQNHVVKCTSPISCDSRLEGRLRRYFMLREWTTTMIHRQQYGLWIYQNMRMFLTGDISWDAASLGVIWVSPRIYQNEHFTSQQSRIYIIFMMGNMMEYDFPIIKPS